MKPVLVRWRDRNNVEVFVGGVFVLSASNDDDFPDEPGVGIATTAAAAITHVVRALGAEAVVVKPEEAS